MSEPRRYHDDEVSEIFEAASRRPGAAPTASPESGLTLAELQEIGREVGIPSERIAEAAAALRTRSRPTARRTILGLPIAVGRAVDLPRPPDDREWAVLVSELRETFAAQGKDVSRGEIRGWRNGNLHAFVEPTDDGWRLRMGTLKGDAVTANRTGAFLLLFALAVVVVMLVAGKPAEDFVVAGLLGAIGAGAFGYNVLRLPAWARRREEQMELVSARARALLEPDADPPGSTPAA